MKKRNVLVITDNIELAEYFVEIVSEKKLTELYGFHYRHHYKDSPLRDKTILGNKFLPINLKEEWDAVVKKYDLVLSVHCKQIFPGKMVEQVRCINIHPGYNPYNRGWFPQVFAILNGKPLGATIHEIDNELDHGKIIVQKTVPVYKSDTSLTAYMRVQAMEVELIRENIVTILAGDYQPKTPEVSGNINLKKDFNELCEIPLEKQATFGEAIDRLRALTHPPYDNAYFIDPENGEKVWVSIQLKTEQKNDDR